MYLASPRNNRCPSTWRLEAACRTDGKRDIIRKRIKYLKHAILMYFVLRHMFSMCSLRAENMQIAWSFFSCDDPARQCTHCTHLPGEGVLENLDVLQPLVSLDLGIVGTT